MAQKEVFVEIVKPCWHGGVQYAAGSVVKMKESEANLCKGLGRGKLSDAKAEKPIPYQGKKVVEPAKVEKK